jgi:ABC-2 type transport system permease protein
MDEPTTGLDPRSRNQLWGVIRALVAAGTTVLLTTQYLDEADQLADQIAVIDNGRVIADRAMAIPGAEPGAGGYREYLVPGMFVMTMLYGVASTATGVALDVEKGVIDRFLSMPMASSAVVTGRSVADMLRALADVVLLVGYGLLVGWQWHNGLGQALAAVGLLLLLRLALTWIGIYLGLVVPTPDSAGLAVYPLTFPLTVVSSAYVPPSMMPGWLGVIAEWNPISATIFAIRELFGNPEGGGASWVAQNAVLLALIWPLLLLAIFVPLSVRRYQQLRR